MGGCREVILNDRSSSLRLRAGFTIAALAIFAGGLALGSRLRVFNPNAHPNVDLVRRVNQLDIELKQLRKQELSPSEIVARSRNSICFIVSTYRLAGPKGQVRGRYRVLATGFLAPGNIVVSNRHVLEPWFGDRQAERKTRRGGVPLRETVVAYFPGYGQAFDLSNITVSKAADVAVADVKLPAGSEIAPLRLAEGTSAPGEPVLVMGYPLGVTTMLAKSTAIPYQLSALREEDKDVGRLARFRLIRPSATQGHLADATGTTLMYDASTARGSSGGPVFNMRGEVIGVNAALITGFTGTSLGVSANALKPLLNGAGQKR